MNLLLRTTMESFEKPDLRGRAFVNTMEKPGLRGRAFVNTMDKPGLSSSGGPTWGQPEANLT